MIPSQSETAPAPAVDPAFEKTRRNSITGGVLGLDLARKWGWCYVARSGDYVASGSCVLKGIDRGEEAHQLQQAISDLVTEYEPDWIAIEKPHSPHYGAARNLFGYAMVAHWVAHIRELGFTELARTECYLAVVNKGNAKKVSAVLHVREHFDPLCNSDDQADAVMVALTAHSRRTAPLTQRAGVGR